MLLLLNSESIFFKLRRFVFLKNVPKKNVFLAIIGAARKSFGPVQTSPGQRSNRRPSFFTHTLSIRPRVAAQAPVVGCRVLRLLDFFLTRKTQHLSPSHRRVDVLKQLVKDFNGKSKLLLLCSLYVILRNCELHEHAISFKFSERC